MKVSSNTKRIANIIVAFFIAGLMSLTLILLLKNDINLDLNKVPKVIGIVTNAQIKSNNKSLVFAFNIDNCRETLGIYNSSADYQMLSNQMMSGDTVTIYYRPKTSNAINTDVFQVEKNGKVIVDYEAYNKSHKTAAWVLGMGIIFIASLGVLTAMKKI